MLPDGNAIRRQRARNGWSSCELAAAAGISETELVLIEHGLRPRLAAGKLFNLAEALGVTCESLMMAATGPIDDADDDWIDPNN